jgi:hypothetical protein
MNLDFRKIFIIILGSLWLWLMISILYGCSASYHFGKFLKKGGTIDTTERIVSVEKVIKVNGKDSIITVLMPLNCPEVQMPLTRQEIRYKYRIQRDSIETIRYVTKWKTKEVVKVAKIQQRKRFNWFWIGLGIGIFIPIYFNFVIKRVYDN